MAPRLDKKSKVNTVPHRTSRIYLAVALCFASIAAMLAAAPARAGDIKLPPEAIQAMDKMYSGDPDGAIAILRNLEQSQPENPLPVLLEGEARWWKIYCANLELRYGMIDAWKRGKKPEDEAFLLLADKVIDLAHAQIAKSDAADMHFYAGMGFALKVRLEVLRGENRAVAHAGVSARSEFARRYRRPGPLQLLRGFTFNRRKNLALLHGHPRRQPDGRNSPDANRHCPRRGDARGNVLPSRPKFAHLR